MKATFLLLFFSISFCFGQSSVGLIASYPLTQNASDISGNGHHGTMTGKFLKSKDRNGDSCATLMMQKGNIGDTGDSIVIPDSPAFHTTAITISVWCKIGDWYHIGPIKLFGKAAPGNKDYLFTVQNTLQFMGNSYAFPRNPFDKWYHFVASYNDGQYSMYVDGIPVKFGTTEKVVFSDSPISMGKYLYGSLDDIRIYDRQLTDNEVSDLFTASALCQQVTAALNEYAPVQTQASIVQAFDVQGRMIADLEHYAGVAIVLYSDGSRRKEIR